MNRALQLVFCLCWNVLLYGQDTEYARSVLNDLCSEQMAGRGYVKNGAVKAAAYISDEYKKSGLLSFGSDYYQPIGYPVITFPNEVSMKADDLELIPGDEFIVSPGSPSLNGVFNTVYIDSSIIDNPVFFAAFQKSSFAMSVLLIDIPASVQLKFPDRLQSIKQNQYKARALIFMNQPKLTWGVASSWDPYPALFVLKGVLKNIPQKITLHIVPEIQSYNGNNVIGYLKGTKYPDSFVVFSAHYDHLGMMGPWAIFPGANDNASGVAMMLDLMHHYKKNPPPYSVCFMAFTGEEAGLFGSYYYTEHPLFPLSKISVLINLDLMGTGDKGMTVVNATLFPADFQDIQLINLENDYLPAVQSRGEARKSDHYYFTEQGIKAFFFYLMGEYPAYHDVFDTAEIVTFSRYAGAYSLIRDYADSRMKTDKH